MTYNSDTPDEELLRAVWLQGATPGSLIYELAARLVVLLDGNDAKTEVPAPHRSWPHET